MRSIASFQGRGIFEVEHRKNGASLRTQLLLHMRKRYLTYGMVMVTFDGPLNASRGFVRDSC